MAASLEDLARVEMSPFGLHWEALDEDISVPKQMAELLGKAAD
jgi:hypothetical protein